MSIQGRYMLLIQNRPADATMTLNGASKTTTRQLARNAPFSFRATIAPGRPSAFSRGEIARKPPTSLLADPLNHSPASTRRKELTQLGNEKHNIPAIQRMVDAEARGAYGGSERTMIELVARLIRAQQAEIERLRGTGQPTGDFMNKGTDDLIDKGTADG